MKRKISSKNNTKSKKTKTGEKLNKIKITKNTLNI